jgi:HEPN domain-containing protein
MKGIDRAKLIFAMATKDFDAINEMKGNQKIADEIFGFHAQQAVEKSLKAWIAASGVEYPQTHNIILLLGALEERKEDVAAYWDFAQLNAFAVQFRYEAYTELGSALDRADVVKKVGVLIAKVKSVIF